jgi:hypothetical protein
MLMAGGRGDRQHSADRLDPVGSAMIVNRADHVLGRRLSSAAAKYAKALRSSRFSRSSAFSFAATFATPWPGRGLSLNRLARIMFPENQSFNSCP